MQVFFKEIIAGDIEAVERRLAKTPAAVDLVATPPPQRYAGQSPLQVAYQHGEFDIAALLLRHDANPNFIENTETDTFVQPVLHHAITTAVMSSRWLAPTRYERGEDRGWRSRNTAEQAEAAFEALQLLLDSGADVHAHDSSDNSSIGRAALDARQILPTHSYNDPEWVDPKPLNSELVADLTRIFNALIERGADLDEVDPKVGKSVREFYRAEHVAKFLNP